MSELLSDVRYALRSLARSPGFAIVALLTLALGIGANSAIFSVLNGVVLRPLPYGSPDRLVRVATQFPSIGFDRFWVSPPEYMELRERTRSFASFGAYRTGMASVGGADAPMRVVSSIATADLFETLGVTAHLGRPFDAAEDVPGGENVATLSYALWQSAFAGDPAIVGRNIIVGGVDTRVTGVMPPGFDVADARVEIWLPARLDEANRQNRSSHYLDVVARLNEGVTIAQARAELDVLVTQWRDATPEGHVPSPDGHPIFLTDLQEDLIGGTRPALLLLFGAVGFVLLIACANVANLLLARAESRQKEIAVRAALGAGRGRLVRQFLTEGVVLSLLGGGLGLFLGYAATRVLLATNPRGIPRALEIALDGNVVAFTLIVSVVTGLIFGLAPAMHLTRRTVTQSLRDGTGRTTASGARQQVRRLLVVSEVALAVVLVVGSGLMLRSFAELQRVDPGFDAEGLLSFQLFLPAATYPQATDQAAFFDRLLDRLRTVPGVTAAAAMSGLPPRRDVNANDTEFEGLAQTEDGPAHNTDYWQFVTRDYVETMGIPLVDGRLFTFADESGTPVVLINERLARVFYPDMNPIGRRLRPPGDNPWLTIVGVVKDVKQGGLEEETGTEIYFLYPQIARSLNFAPRTMNVVLRTAGDPMQLAGAVREVVRTFDPQLPAANMASMADVLHESVARPRFITLLLAVFAAVALALAAIGTYGVMSYAVAQRRQEIGIRMALGARAGSVLGMVLGQGFTVAGIGLVLGVGGALALTRLMSSLLFNISATDPLAFVGAPLLLALVALAACYIPARRATRVDPALVLKQDCAPGPSRRPALKHAGPSARRPVTQLRPACNPGLPMDTLGKDVRFGARMLVRNAGSTAISVIALALGIGLTTMAFSIVWGAVLRGLPFDRAEELVMVFRTNLAAGEDQMGVSVHDYEDWRAQQTSFTDLAAFYTGTINVSGTDAPERFDGGFMTVNAFDLIGVQPVLGRGFTADDGRVGAEPVMLLGYDTWRNRFGADPAIVGRTVRANGRPTTIIGVMPEGFRFPNTEQLWIPLGLDASALPRNDGTWLGVYGRLRDGVTLDRAASEMASIAARLEAEYPDTNEGIGTDVRPYVRGFIGDEAVMMLFTMLGAVFMVLLIACANVANLLIARAAARSREVGIRTAMGASGIRIVRQFLTESVLLSAAGAAIGIGIALIGMRLFNQAIAPTDPPFWIDIRLDGSVLYFVIGITVLSGLISGAIPAWQASRANVADVLKDESRGGSSFRLGRISRALVVTEIALSAGLLVGAGLMIKSVTKVRTIDFPFASADVFTARIGLPEAQYGDAQSQRRFFEELMPRLRAMPGVAGVGLIQALPAIGAPRERFAIEGATYPEERDYPLSNTLLIGPGAFEALEVAVLQGRDFTDGDREGSRPVAIVNEGFVRRFFDGGDAIGRRIRIGTRDSQQDWRTIVGVVPDMFVGGLDDLDEPEAIYVPIAQSSARFMTVLARARAGDPMLLTQPVREAVLAVDPDLPMYYVQTLKKAINDNNWFYMVFGSIFMVFGGAALFLAAVGLYGVMSTSVRQRTRELGVRMALGAQRADVRGLVMRQGLVQLTIGLVLGLALALFVSSLLQLLLFEVNPRDPAIFLAIGAVLTATAVTACLVPAIRATRVDPMHALRYD